VISGLKIVIREIIVDYFLSQDKISTMTSGKISRWFPAILMMATIFIFSSMPSDSLPNFNFLDRLIKKGGHMLGYGFLAQTYWYAMRNTGRRHVFAWLLAVLFAASDEFHQSLVPGRHASAWDVLIFDNLGAAIGILVATVYSKNKK